MTYDEALSKIREEAEAERETGLTAIGPLDADAVLDLVLELGSRLTCLEKREAHRVAKLTDPANLPAQNLALLSRKNPDGSWERP